MIAKKILPCLNLKDGRVVQTFGFAGAKDIGDPVEVAQKFVQDGADEIVFLDIAANSDSRKKMLELVRRTSTLGKVPILVGGGVETMEYIEELLEAGADKFALSSAATRTPSLIAQASKRFGGGRTVVAIDAKHTRNGFAVMARGGTLDTGRSPAEWAAAVEELGAGEILLTSMDYNGTTHGYDIALIKMVTEAVHIPVIASGGCGALEHFTELFAKTNCDSALAAALFHIEGITIPQVKSYLSDAGISIRK